MRKIIHQTIKHPLFSSSFVMIVGTNTINAINYLYHVIMGRILGPVAYGELSVLFSLITLISVIPFSLSTVVIKFVASAKNDQEVSSYIKWFNKPILIVSILVTAAVIVLSPFISAYLNTTNILGICLIGLSFLFVFPSALYRAVLQGLIKFPVVVTSLISEASVKLIAGFLLVFIGFGVTGGVLGVLLSIIVGFGLSFYFIKPYQRTVSETKINGKEILLFIIPVLLQTAASTSFMSADLILVKHFFPEFEVGVFAAVSTLGKIILFASAPVAAVMFPIVSRKFAKREPFTMIFLFSLLMTFGAGLMILIVYGMFPQVVLTMLYGNKYLAGTAFILPYGVFCLLLSLTGVFTNFYLSTGQKKIIWLLVAAALFQIGGIEMFHQDLFQVILVNIVVMMVLFILLTIYFVLNLKKYHSKKPLLPD